MWFNEHAIYWLGAVLGVVVGLGCGTWSVLAGIYAPKDKHQWLILNTARLIISTGILMLLTGGAAYIDNQPYYVWYSFALCGFIAPMVIIPLYFNIKRVYTTVALAKLQANTMAATTSEEVSS